MNLPHLLREFHFLWIRKQRIKSTEWGTYHMFTVDERYKIRQRTSQFFAAQMITQKWVQPRNAEHRLFAASSDLRDEKEMC
jgi:hypothetical protein